MVVLPPAENKGFWRKRQKWRVCVLHSKTKCFGPQTPENDENDENHSGKTMVYQKRGFHNADNLDLQNSTQKLALVGGSLEIVVLAWSCQLWREILKFFDLWALRAWVGDVLVECGKEGRAVWFSHISSQDTLFARCGLVVSFRSSKATLCTKPRFATPAGWMERNPRHCPKVLRKEGEWYKSGGSPEKSLALVQASHQILVNSNRSSPVLSRFQFLITVHFSQYQGVWHIAKHKQREGMYSKECGENKA